MTTDQKKPERRKGRRAINWIGGITALAAMLSGVAAMITAANGVWHPPVPIPVVKVAVGWVGPTPSASPRAASTATPAPAPTPSDSESPVPTPPPGPSTVADLGSGVTMWITAVQPEELELGVANHGPNPFVLDFNATDVSVYDDQSAPHFYAVASVGGGHETVASESTSCAPCAFVYLREPPASMARHMTIAFRAISGRENITIVYALA